MPRETITEILIKLPVSDVLRYCQTYSGVSNISSDENFSWQYLNRNWPNDYLQKVLSFDLSDVPNSVDTILSQRIGNPQNIEFITNLPLAIAVFLENSKLISLTQIDANFLVGFEKIILISRYDKLGTFFDELPLWALCQTVILHLLAQMNIFTLKKLENVS
jgi:hypothetical protein